MQKGSSVLELEFGTWSELVDAALVRVCRAGGGAAATLSEADCDRKEEASSRSIFCELRGSVGVKGCPSESVSEKEAGDARLVVTVSVNIFSATVNIGPELESTRSSARRVSMREETVLYCRCAVMKYNSTNAVTATNNINVLLNLGSIVILRRLSQLLPCVGEVALSL